MDGIKPDPKAYKRKRYYRMEFSDEAPDEYRTRQGPFSRAEWRTIQRFADHVDNGNKASFIRRCILFWLMCSPDNPERAEWAIDANRDLTEIIESDYRLGMVARRMISAALRAVDAINRLREAKNQAATRQAQLARSEAVRRMLGITKDDDDTGLNPIGRGEREQLPES